ncbi:hypothetical protein [Bosea sp. BIWAKO-01]|uniref:hypothetical protein n=1 Tax=Bosea sp. BIWAKO-01 TaxID=506668 RepID=UPI000853E427|nr:hypothetical protein [Bosea sp. BIWAKO-01]
MPFHSIVATPEEIAVIVAAFETAWGQIHARGEIERSRAPLQRERLSYIVVGLWGEGSIGQLAERAVQQFDATAANAPTLPRRTKRPADSR